MATEHEHTENSDIRPINVRPNIMIKPNVKQPNHDIAKDEVNWLPIGFQLCSKSETYITGLVSSEVELIGVLEWHSKVTSTTFISWSDDKKTTADVERRFLWQTEDISDNVPLTVTRRKIMTCQHGKNYHKKKESKLQNVHGPVKKSRFHIQNSRKLNCPAKIFIRYITRYEDFKVAARASKKEKEKTIRQLKESVLQKGIEGIDVIHVKLPLFAAHENHAVSEEGAFSRSIHPAIKEQIYDSVSQGITSVPALKKNIKQFVNKTLCPPGTGQPHNCDRRYYPTSRTIQNQVHLALQAEEMSEFDQKNLEDKIKKWLKADPNSRFFFRKSTKSNDSFETQNTNFTKSDGLPCDADFIRETKEACEVISPGSTFLFIHQAAKQRFLLERYGNVVLLDVMLRTTKCSLPVFLVAVRTNFGYIPVAEFIPESETTGAILEALKILKEWNPNWEPKTFMLDYSEEEFEALEVAFPDSQKLLCAFHVEQAWQRWIRNGKNDVSDDDGKELIQILRKISNAATNESVAKEIELLRASTVYNQYQTVKNYLENQWLNICQRWCRAYASYDFNFTMRTNNGIEVLCNSLKKFHLSLTGSTTMTSLVETLVKTFVPDLLLMYSQHNYQSSSQFKAYNPTVPEYLHDRPKTFITACLKTSLAATRHEDWDIHVFGNGQFEVKSEKKSEHCNVYLGNEESFPFCDCAYFSSNFMPCKHMFAIFNHTDYTWDSFPTFYRNHVLFTLDTGCISDGNSQLLADIDTSKCEDKGRGGILESSINFPHDKEIDREVSEAQRELRDDLKLLSDLLYLSTDINNLRKAAEHVRKARNLLKSTVEASKGLPVHTSHVTENDKRELPKRSKGRTKKRKHSSADNDVSITGSNCQPMLHCQPEEAEISTQDESLIPKKKPKFCAVGESTVQENELPSQLTGEFKKKVLAFLDVGKLQQLSEFLVKVNFSALSDVDDCESQPCGSLPAANSLVLETRMNVDKLDYIKEQISVVMPETWKDKTFKENIDIFQVLVATVLVAVENDLELVHIKEMYETLPSHHIVLDSSVNELCDKVRVGSTTLTSGDIDTIGQGKWLNDQVLHAYLDLLMEEHPHKVFVFPSFLPLKWEKKDYDSWLYPEVDFMAYQWLIFMIHHDSHWFLLVADTLNKTIFFLDSLKDERREKCFYEHWCEYISARNKAVSNKTKVPTFKLVQMSSGKQLDGNSCGIFVLMNAEALLSGIPVGVMRHHHVAHYRDYVKRRLLAVAKASDDVTCDLPFCFKPSQDMVLVQCAKCHHWYHNTCAEITAVLKNEPFGCIFCKNEPVVFS